MSAPAFSFLANDKLPPVDDIVAVCQNAGYKLSGIPLRDSLGHILAWVKYGPHVTVDEAATQHWVAEHLDANPEANVRVPRVYDAFSISNADAPIEFIVMEYIDASDCTEKDVQLVAGAVQTLIGIRGPSSVPGHVGGASVAHTFFLDEAISPFMYKTVHELEQHVHINGILRHRRDTRQVADAEAGLRLCPCDIHPSNFKKAPDGKVVALDFEVTCFLPPSFFAVAVRKAAHTFAVRVAQQVDYPKLKDVAALVAASYYLVPFGRNDIGAPRGLCRRQIL